MSDSFALLFSSLLDSSVWIGQPHHVVRVWIAMILLKDEQGIVSQTVRGLARRACVTEVEALEALKVLQEPDADSRNPENEGRRIEAVRGGWLLLNHKPYRSRQALELERARKRDDARKRRDTPLQTATDRYDPLLAATGGEKTLLSVSVSASASEIQEGVQGEPDPDSSPTVTEIRRLDPPPRPPDRTKGIFVPDDWEPKDSHRVRCQELRFDIKSLVRDFRNHEFNREYSDWDRRFSQWIEKEKTNRETASAKALAAPPARAGPRRHGSAQQDHGVDPYSFHRGSKS
jgi:hypothetical protein